MRRQQRLRGVCGSCHLFRSEDVDLGGVKGRRPRNEAIKRAARCFAVVVFFFFFILTPAQRTNSARRLIFLGSPISGERRRDGPDVANYPPRRRA